MHPILRNLLAVLAGLIIGGFVNGGLVQLGMKILPMPGIVYDPDNLEPFLDFMNNKADYRYFLSPFIAHALGSLVGAFVCAKIAISKRRTLALVIGGFFLIGGVYMAQLIPNAPLLFTCSDLILASLPAAWLGYYIAKKDLA